MRLRVRKTYYLVPALALAVIWFCYSRPRQAFGFLTGLKPVFATEGTYIYSLTTDFETLHRRIDHELLKRGFHLSGETNRSNERVIEYRSDNGESRIYLVQVMDQPGQVVLQIFELESPSRVAQSIRDARAWLRYRLG